MLNYFNLHCTRLCSRRLQLGTEALYTNCESISNFERALIRIIKKEARDAMWKFYMDTAANIKDMRDASLKCRANLYT
jgi:hypothetical protein